MFFVSKMMTYTYLGSSIGGSLLAILIIDRVPRRIMALVGLLVSGALQIVLAVGRRSGRQSKKTALPTRRIPICSGSRQLVASGGKYGYIFVFGLASLLLKAGPEAVAFIVAAEVGALRPSPPKGLPRLHCRAIRPSCLVSRVPKLLPFPPQLFPTSFRCRAYGLVAAVWKLGSMVGSLAMLPASTMYHKWLQDKARRPRKGCGGTGSLLTQRPLVWDWQMKPGNQGLNDPSLGIESLIVGISAGVTLFAMVPVAMLPETRTRPLERLNDEHRPEHIEVRGYRQAVLALYEPSRAASLATPVQSLRPWQRKMLAHAVRTEAPEVSNRRAESSERHSRLSSQRQPSSAGGLHKGPSIASQLPPINHNMQPTKPVVLPAVGMTLMTRKSMPALAGARQDSRCQPCPTWPVAVTS